MSDNAKKIHPTIEAFCAANAETLRGLRRDWAAHIKSGVALKIRWSREAARYWFGLDVDQQRAARLEEFRAAMVSSVTDENINVGSMGTYLSQANTILQKGSRVEVCEALGLNVDTLAVENNDIDATDWTALYLKYKKTREAKPKKSDAEVAEEFFRAMNLNEQIRFLTRVYGEDLVDLIAAFEEAVAQ